MPWKIYKEGNKYCVHKENANGSKGDKAGCHSSEEEARQQQQALYVHAKEIMRVEDMTIVKAKPAPPPPGKKPKHPPQEEPTSWGKIRDTINNLIGGGGKPSGGEPTEGKNPIKNEPPHGPMPGIPPKKTKPEGKNPIPAKKPDKPNEGKNPIPKKILVKPPYKKELGDKAILFTKEGERIRWLCDFTNNFRDRDNPSEILASAAHERFVKEVDSGEWPMPELWWWHMDGTRIGQADWLDYDKENGISLASGLIDKGMESIADAIAHYPEKVGTSHGMIVPLLERDIKDKSIITRYVTREISALPARAAANTLTEILIGKEKNMAITEAKKTSLKTLGFSEAQIKDVEDRNKAKADEAKASGIESKEAEAPVVEPVPEEAPAEEVVETPVEAPIEVPAEPTVEEPADKAITHKEFTAAMEAMVKGIAEAIKPLQAEQNRIGSLVATMESKAREEAKKELSMTPSSSIGAMFARRFSAVGKSETAIDGRESLVKSGPRAPVEESNSALPSFVRNIYEKPQ